MADDSDLEKTEPPSARKIQQAREEGQVPQSRELSTFLVLIIGVAGLWFSGGWMGQRVLDILDHAFSFDRALAFDTKQMLAFLDTVMTEGVLTVLPLFGILLLAALAAPILLGGFVFSPKALGFKFEKLNLFKGLGRMVSIQSLVELLKSILKTCVIGVMAFLVMLKEQEHVFTFMNQALSSAIPDFFQTVLQAAFLIVFGLALIALVDVPFQLWQYRKKLRMTKEEVRRENKEQEGDPQLKGRIRSQQREMARKRMMSEVPKADVIVTNPTHFSVALKYDAQRMDAPTVVAKGKGALALKIREIAEGAAVPVVEFPPLARALYAHCDLEQSVPAVLYRAVAEVIAYVYQLEQWLSLGGERPQDITSMSLPPGLDPGEVSS